MPALPLVDEIPEPPAWLSSDAAVEYRGLASMLHANSLLTAGNTFILAHACMIHSRLVEAWVSGATPGCAWPRTNGREAIGRDARREICMLKEWFQA